MLWLFSFCEDLDFVGFLSMITYVLYTQCLRYNMCSTWFLNITISTCSILGYQDFHVYPWTFWDVSHPSRYILCALSILGYPRVFRVLSGLPGLFGILHTTAESQTYVSFFSWDIPGLPGMSVICNAIAES